MRLVLVTPQLESGHHPIYVRLITEEAYRRGWKVRLLTTQSAGGASNQHLLPVNSILEIHRTLRPVQWPSRVTPFSMLQYQYQMFRGMQKGVADLLRSEAADFIYVTNLDYFHRIAAFCGSPFSDVPFAGLLANVRFHLSDVGIIVPKSRRDPIDAWMFRRLIRIPTLKAVLTTDDTLPAHEQMCGAKGCEKVRSIPEIVTVPELLDRDAVKLRLGVTRESFIILCYGALSARKGVTQLLSALSSEECPKETVVLLAGRQGEDVRRILNGEAAVKLRKAGRLLEWNKFVSEEEELDAYSACDLVWLGYVGYFGISGVTIQAAVSGRPSISCEEGIVGHWVRSYKIGLTTDVHNPKAVCDTIRRLKDDVALRRSLEENGAKLRKRHNRTSFAKAICDSIESNTVSGGGISQHGKASRKSFFM